MPMVGASPDVSQRSGLLLPLLAVGVLVTYTSNWLWGPLLVPLSAEFGVSVPIMGQVATGMAMVWGISGPTAGPISDRYGRKPVLAGGLLAIGASCLAVSLGWSYGSLLVFRLLSAVGSGAYYPVALATVADHFPAHRRGRALSWIILAMPIASLAGVPAMAWIAEAVGWRWAFRLIAVAAALLCILLLWGLPPARHVVTLGFGYRARFREALRAPSAVSLLLANAFAQAGYSGLNLFLPAFLMQSYGLDMGQVAPILSIVALGSLIGNQLGGALADRFGRARLYALAQALQGLVTLPLMFVAPGLAISTSLGGANAGFQSLGRPAYSALIIGLSSRVRGTMAGINAISNQSGMATGTALSGLALSFGGYGAVGVVSATACFIGAVLLMRVPHVTSEPAMEETVGVTVVADQ